MKITNKLNLPAGFVKACTTERHNKDGEISATTLLKGVKEIILTARHWDELEDDVANRVWAVWGTAVHALMKHEGETDFCEEILSKKIGEKTLTGKFDNYDMASGVITDYKTCSAWKIKLEDFDDWRKQGLIYAYLLRENGFPVTACRFTALIKDHSKTEAGRDLSYPQSPVYVYEFNVNDSDIESIIPFIEKKIKTVSATEILSDDDIEPCSPVERWAMPDKWAVMKTGRKSAVRVLDSEQEAAELCANLGAGHYVEYRKGVSRKCKDYCICKDFCDFYKNNVKGDEE